MQILVYIFELSISVFNQVVTVFSFNLAFNVTYSFLDNVISLAI